MITKLSDTQKQEIIAMYDAGGVSHADISTKMNVSLPTVSKCLRGIKPAKRKYTNTKGAAVADRNATILRMVKEEGAKAIDIANKLGMTRQNVSLILRKNNIPKYFVRKRLMLHSIDNA